MIDKFGDIPGLLAAWVANPNYSQIVDGSTRVLVGPMEGGFDLEQQGYDSLTHVNSPTVGAMEALESTANSRSAMHCLFSVGEMANAKLTIACGFQLRTKGPNVENYIAQPFSTTEGSRNAFYVSSDSEKLYGPDCRASRR